jgi:hypothetical protein
MKKQKPNQIPSILPEDREGVFKKLDNMDKIVKESKKSTPKGPGAKK